MWAFSMEVDSFGVSPGVAGDCRVHCFPWQSIACLAQYQVSGVSDSSARWCFMLIIRLPANATDSKSDSQSNPARSERMGGSPGRVRNEAIGLVRPPTSSLCRPGQTNCVHVVQTHISN